MSHLQSQAEDIKTFHQPQNQYFQRVKAIYRGKHHRPRETRNSQYQNSRISSGNTEQVYTLGTSLQKIHKTDDIKNTQKIGLKKQNPSYFGKSKLHTQSKEPSPSKFRYYLNKVQRERTFHTNMQNDRMVRRLYEIKSRQNKYMKESRRLMQFSNEHKMMHESSVIAKKKLLEREMQEKNDKFVDRLIERVKHKQMIKPPGTQRIAKCVRLQESRARMFSRARGTVQLPPMVFQ